MKLKEYESAFICSSITSHMHDVWGQIAYLNIIIG